MSSQDKKGKRIATNAKPSAIFNTQRAGEAYMVEIFEKIGVGQWLRVVTGILEVGGGVLLFIPRRTFHGAVMLTCVMAGAIPRT